MANPIPLGLPPRDPRQILFEQLQEAPREHAEALLATYEVLQGLHDRGVLELIRGALGSGDKVLEIIVDAAKKPESIHALRNLVVLAKIAGSMDTKLLENLAQAVSENETATREPLSLWQLLKKLNSKDSRRALTALTGVLESAGQSLNSGKQDIK